MKCPFCGSPNNSQVIESRARAGGVTRRRKCLKCKGRFSTREILTDATETKLLKEDRRAANKSFRVLAEQNALLWENQATMISLCRRILKTLGSDDTLHLDLEQLSTTPRRPRS